MSERLRDDIEGLGVLCAQAAEWHREQGSTVSSAIIEKDFGVTAALRVLTQMQADATQGLRYHSRHDDDVHQLLSDLAVQLSLAKQPDLVAQYAESVAEESVAVRRPGVQRPEGGFGASLAFSDEIVERAAEQYDAELTRLSFGGYPPLKDVAALLSTAGSRACRRTTSPRGFATRSRSPDDIEAIVGQVVDNAGQACTAAPSSPQAAPSCRLTKMYITALTVVR